MARPLSALRIAASALLAAISFASFVPTAQAAPPARPSLSTLSPNARELFAESMQLSASSFDSSTHLILRPSQSHTNAVGHFMVRESSWYALGLLMRDQPGDRALAASILQAVLANQYLTPGTRWYGTFKRTPEEPEPATDSIAFTSYDPNWRQFIGTTFQLILIQYPDRIPASLADQLYRSIDNAILGEQKDGRLKPSYTNIALMYGALWDFAATHNRNAQWKRDSAAWTQEVYRLFQQHNSFFEYNSPTYYGTDLYGLALWRQYGSTPQIRRMGASMYDTLWNDIADFYQPSLRNIAGPYDRSYGMDMESYVAVTGVWLRGVLDAAHAPLPPISLSTDHVADLWFAPLVVAFDAPIPAPALAKFRAFTGPHLVTRRIDDQRTATAWIGLNAIWGGEATQLSKDAPAGTQFHPATVQWRTPSGSIGWLYLMRAPKLDATADPQGITIDTTGDLIFRIHAEGLDVSQLTAARWTLPGLPIDIATSATFTVAPTPGTQAPGTFDVTYRNVQHLRLNLHPAPTP